VAESSEITGLGGGGTMLSGEASSVGYCFARAARASATKSSPALPTTPRSVPRRAMSRRTGSSVSMPTPALLSSLLGASPAYSRSTT
jgi:hypothetical protein